MPHRSALLLAVKQIGSQSKLADALGLSRYTVNKWINRDLRIPFEYAVAIEYLTQGVITRYELAPHIRWLQKLERTYLKHLSQEVTNHASLEVTNSKIHSVK